MYGIPILNVTSDSSHYEQSLTLTLDQSLQIIATGSGIEETKIDTVAALKIKEVLSYVSGETVVVHCKRWGGKFYLRHSDEGLVVISRQNHSFEHVMKLSELQIKVLNKIIEIACAGIE